MVFLDAAVLAAPVTRSLILFGQAHRQAAFVARWSFAAEAEADAALARRAAAKRAALTSVARLREVLDWGGEVLVDPAPEVESALADTDAKDRHVLAAAVGAGAALIVTPNVSDFGPEDLKSLGVCAVHPDLFLEQMMVAPMYRFVLQEMAVRRSRPPRTPEDIHVALGALHPRLVQSMTAVYPRARPVPPTDHPAEVFRGWRCVSCGKTLSDPASLTLGLGPECRKRPAGRA